MGLKRDALIKMATTWAGPMAARVLPRPKKTIDIEALLKWTYLQELPKRPKLNGPSEVDSAWRKVGEWIEELSLAGCDENSYGVVCDFAASSWPHDDAYIVHEAVGWLDSLELGLPDDWSPIDDLGDLGALGKGCVARAIDILTIADSSGVRRLKGSPRRLVFKHAILGGCPDWEADAPEKKFMQKHGMTRWFRKIWVNQEAAFGDVRVEREIDGFDRKLRIPYADAYPKEYLDPDPIDSVIGRAEYEIWHSALAFLVDELQGALGDFAPVMTKRPERPWESGVSRKSFIWPDLSERATKRVERTPRRSFDIPSARKRLEIGGLTPDG